MGWSENVIDIEGSLDWMSESLQQCFNILVTFKGRVEVILNKMMIFQRKIFL